MLLGKKSQEGKNNRMINFGCQGTTTSSNEKISGSRSLYQQATGLQSRHSGIRRRNCPTIAVRWNEPARLHNPVAFIPNPAQGIWSAFFREAAALPSVWMGSGCAKHYAFHLERDLKDAGFLPRISETIVTSLAAAAGVSMA